MLFRKHTLVTQEYEFISPILNTCKRKKRDKAKLCTSAKVQRELKYCIDLKRIAKTGIHGVNRAFIQFRVNKTGEIDNVKVRSPHPVISEEIERCFSDMKLLFLPGTTNGVNDSFLFSMPVTFSFE